MRVHVIQHAFFEGPAIIETWCVHNDMPVGFTHIYDNQKLPSLDSFDLLVVMGGPMSANETDKYDWLEYELNFIKTCIEQNKSILGVCLGAQLIAKVLGSEIYNGKYPEIGWLPIVFDKKDISSDFKACLPDYVTTFHWHGETFDTPQGAISIASSPGTPNQGFIYRDRVIALQFHMEVTEEAVMGFLDNMGHEITEGRYIQPKSSICTGFINIPDNNQIMNKLLTYLSNRIY